MKVLECNTAVEIVFQGTDLLAGTDHPMHLHGYSFYVVGGGFGNFDRAKDAKRFNFVEPSLQNTIMVPKNVGLPLHSQQTIRVCGIIFHCAWLILLFLFLLKNHGLI